MSKDYDNNQIFDDIDKNQSLPKLPDHVLQPPDIEDEEIVLSPMQDTIVRQQWDDFRDNGLLWYVNTMLQPLGYSIVVTLDEHGKVYDAYPARVSFRGYSQEAIISSSTKLIHYLKASADDLLDDLDNYA